MGTTPRLQRLRNKIARKYYTVFYQDRTVIAKYQGLKLLLKPANHLDRWFKRGLPYESEQLAFVMSELAVHDCHWFVDVGANMGIYSLMLAEKGPRLEKIVAIEAQRENYHQLCANIFLNQFDRYIEAINKGVSDHRGTVNFLRNVGHSTGTFRIQDTAPDATKFHRFEEEPLEVDTLDNLLGQVEGKRLLIKIDVEGHEQQVLTGARQTLEKNHCVIQTELLTEPEKTAQQIADQYGLEVKHHIGNDYYFVSR